MHVLRGEGLGRKAGDLIAEILVTRRDEAVLLEIQGVAYFEVHPTFITMGRQVSCINVIAQE